MMLLPARASAGFALNLWASPSRKLLGFRQKIEAEIEPSQIAPRHKKAAQTGNTKEALI